MPVLSQHISLDLVLDPTDHSGNRLDLFVSTGEHNELGRVELIQASFQRKASWDTQASLQGKQTLVNTPTFSAVHFSLPCL